MIFGGNTGIKTGIPVFFFVSNTGIFRYPVSQLRTMHFFVFDDSVKLLLRDINPVSIQ